LRNTDALPLSEMDKLTAIFRSLCEIQRRSDALTWPQAQQLISAVGKHSDIILTALMEYQRARDAEIAERDKVNAWRPAKLGNGSKRGVRYGVPLARAKEEVARD
jgi:hypothetical protein